MHGWLVLDSGEVYKGQWLGGEPSAGEMVFNTSHSGYEEIATDPSYLSQIVVMTAPQQGNYGADRKVWESRRIWIEGFVCLQMMNSQTNNSWLNVLNENNVPVVTELDTRAIAKRLRSKGTTWGALVKAENKESAVSQANSLIKKKKIIEPDWVWLASRKENQKLQGSHSRGPRVAVVDFGMKENILRELLIRCSEVTIFPSRVEVQEIIDYNPDGIMLTNGPGDPAAVEKAPVTINTLIGKYPIFGICMGHQILSLALGAKTYKLKFGHRGSNHPIKDNLLHSVYMSSQNHGYAVMKETLPEDVAVTHVNLNDNTVAGIYSSKRNCLGIQYHPESHPGPHDASGLFDFFIREMIGSKK